MGRTHTQTGQECRTILMSVEDMARAQGCGYVGCNWIPQACLLTLHDCMHALVLTSRVKYASC